MLSDIGVVLQNSNLYSSYYYHQISTTGRSIPAFIVIHGLGNTLDSEIAVNLAKQYNIPDCPSGVARPAKQPEFQLVLHQG